MDELIKRLEQTEARMTALELALRDSHEVLSKIVDSWEEVIVNFANRYGIELPGRFGKMVTIPCPCSQTEHYADAVFCTNCGKKLERAAANDTRPETHMRDSEPGRGGADILSKAYSKITVLDTETGEELAVITHDLITTAESSIVVKLTPSYD